MEDAEGSGNSGCNLNINFDTVEQKDLIALLNKQDFSDVTLIVEGREIYAHQVILASRSTYF
jgi:membrane-bound inhibitor of C-type lysozyme